LLSEPSNVMSWVRPERIGPTGSAPLLWNTAANRVTPSTFSSYTMSASLSPLCGRASGLLSILTTIAGRVSASGLTSGRPVSGYVGPGTVVVVAASDVAGASVVAAGLSVVVVGFSVTAGVVGAPSFEPELQAAARKLAAMAAVMTCPARLLIIT